MQWWQWYSNSILREKKTNNNIYVMTERDHTTPTPSEAKKKQEKLENKKTHDRPNRPREFFLQIFAKIS